MANCIAEISLPWGPKYYAIWRGFDGRLLTWNDLEVAITDAEVEKLPEEISNQLGAQECAAWFRTREEAEKVLNAYNRSI